MDNNVEHYYDYVLKLVKDAGKVILEANNMNVETKDEDWDVVTEYDRKVEATLIEKIKNNFPEHKFIGEEESSVGGISDLTEHPTWIIDPIDGTANFVRRLPITCISVGLTVKKEQVLGIIYNPFMDELYSAIKGKGAFFNGTRLFTSGVEEISKTVFSYELSLARDVKYKDLYMYRLQHLISQIQGIRSFGCAALSLCYVASGRLDAYQCDGLYPWDAAAGVLIVREAGGFVCRPEGTEFDLMRPDFLATATRELADQFVAIEKVADDERKAKRKY